MGALNPMFWKNVKSIETPRLLVGHGQYVNDIELVGMLHMSVVRSPHAHAEIRNVDLDEALAMPGVVDAFTIDVFGAEPPSLPVVASNESLLPAPQFPLARGRVRFAGEAVAVILAQTLAEAEDAAEMVDVDYEELPVLSSYDQAINDGAVTLHEGAPGNVYAHWTRGEDDLASVIESAPVVVRTRVDMQRYTGVPLETRGLVVYRDPISKKLIVNSSSQTPHMDKLFLAMMLGLGDSEVRVAVPDIGGGFGVKQGLYAEDFLAAFAAERLGRPVKWIETRSENFTSSSHARQQHHEVELALTEDGDIIALRDRMYTDIGGYVRGNGLSDTDITATTLTGPYRIPQVFVDIHAVGTNKSPAAPYRGAGHPEATYVRERVMDVAARQLGMDPVEFRRRNLVESSDFPYDMGLSSMYGPFLLDSGDYPKALDTAVEESTYRAVREKQKNAVEGDGKLYGVGAIMYSAMGGPGPFEGASIEVSSDGIFTISSGVVPLGQGTVTTMAQIVANVFDMPMDQVRGRFSDTDEIEYGVGTFGSRVTSTAGVAFHRAALQVKDQFLALTEQELEVSRDDLVFADGSVHVKGVRAEGPSRSLAELTRLAGPLQPRPEGVGVGIQATAYVEDHSAPFSYAVHVAEVEIDVKTCMPKVTNYHVVSDAGTIINPALAEGQIIGGIAQGLGGALLEELVYDDDGQLTTASLEQYLMPLASDVPSISITHMESPSPLNELGVKGLGEGGAIGAHAAVANAVLDALASAGLDSSLATPLSPDKIWGAIRGSSYSRV